ncbi:unnamed protein product [Acanthoscelides obtectus]|uniref:Ecto-NOX disulfide-thiol exchanger 1/2 domain-containing protein n=1 Tax=Acanthoscelides obtectus TaxID=200917 RepID=A0A9P0MLG0_ACAOB|nr:unnamed protein product [Acanthoscelides obtectus]CAK1626592.1 Ecto-NOX disulfide-thiol exchanger 1 [Acanthoscelides obtectus]
MARTNETVETICFDYQQNLPVSVLTTGDIFYARQIWVYNQLFYSCSNNKSVEVLKLDYKKDMEDKDKQFKVLQQTLQGMQQQLLEAKKRQCEEEARVKDLQSKLSGEKPPRKHDRKILTDKEIINLDDSENEQCDSVSVSECLSEAATSTTSQRLNECDAKLVGIISTFLNVHPFGAGLDYIWSYVSKIEPNIRPSDIESLMIRFPSVFKQELVGIGANIERKWIFNAFCSAPNGKS